MMLKTTATEKKVSQVAPLFNPFNAIVAKTQHRVLSDFVKPCGVKCVKQLLTYIVGFTGLHLVQF
jgi:hypothetical protein